MASYSQKEINHTVKTFRYKLTELESLVENANDDISLINSARIIRDLLISDQNGLIGEISRIVPGFKKTKNNKLRFKAKIIIDSHHERIGPGDSDFKTKLVVPQGQEARESAYNRDDYLKLPVVEINHELGIVIFTTKDIIKFFANKLGAVHLDYKKSGDPTDLLYDLWELSDSRNLPDVVRTLLGISAVVITTCKTVDARLIKLGYE